ncbi:glutamate decarboxylase 2 [Lingula anatina]|uniref:Glutamate decarboxylase 2 n=1 Tax=Lingula anatina TaxID=7574 RepID=A0A2R2MMK0_LINAN|nr:glutamate decarboxylase 2 [Lingula anatina]|eukprot:XP_023931282.1 glutamate decarboxylase 2 [Lingula anatina]
MAAVCFDDEGYNGLIGTPWQHIDISSSIQLKCHWLLVNIQSLRILRRTIAKTLNEAHCANACYLFQQDKCYDISYDTGDKSVQCGRKVDAFKLWLMWKERGHKGFERDIDNIFDMSRYLTQLVKDREGFELVLGEPQCTNVCFWYIPPSLRSLKRTAEWWQKLGKVAPKIKERMMVEGTMMVGYQPLGDYVNFIRMVISNLNVTKEDMEFVVVEIERLGKDL